MNILVVEDHKVLQEGIVNYVRANVKFADHVFFAENGKEALHILNGGEKVDIVITDLNMPKLNGIEFVKIAKSRYPHLKIIILTMYYNRSLVRNLKELNIDAFLTKNASLDELKIAIDKVIDDETYISSSIKTLFQDNQIEQGQEFVKSDGFAEVHSLSKREVDVLKRMVGNKSNPEIADELFVSVETIKSHRKNIYRKLGVNNVLDLYKLLMVNNYFGDA